jgi:hypothetical protein
MDPSCSGAAWALVQLRCPNTAVLAKLSQELLQPQPWLWDQQAFRVKEWHSTAATSQQRRQLLAKLTTGDVRDAAAAFSSRCAAAGNRDCDSQFPCFVSNVKKPQH